MASFRRKKEALRAASYAFVAGAHYISSQVVRSVALRTTPAVDSQTLLNDFEALMTSPQAIEAYTEHLNEEVLYPFGSDWSVEVLRELIAKIIVPSLATGPEEDARLRFKKGYKNLLISCAEACEGGAPNDELLDHWLTLLLNSAFFGSMSIAARHATNPKLFYSVLDEIETEIEPWSHYDQLVNVLDRQLRRETRRKTGLVTEYEIEQ